VTTGGKLGEPALASPARATQNLRVAVMLSRREKRDLMVGVVLLAGAALLPLVDTGYWLGIGVSVAMFTVLATSWILFSGPTNYISLATAAFFGIGMYIVAGGLDLLPFPALVVLAALAGAVFAAVVGLATLRISGVYFVIFTLGLAELVRQVMAWAQHVMGTSSGLYVLIGMSDATLYWLLLALAALVYLVGWWIGRSRLGFALRIIGNDEVVAVHCGINTARAKVVLFVISCTFAAITGALVAPRYSYVEPTLAFSPFLSFETVIMALLGGVHRLWGPLVGVIPFTLLWEFFSREFPSQTTLLLGACFLLIVYFIPRGVVGLIEDLIRNRGFGSGPSRHALQSPLDAGAGSLKEPSRRRGGNA
jgi:branched-chain amino acid transport system permease protein